MPKKRKTRQQKVQKEERKQEISKQSYSLLTMPLPTVPINDKQQPVMYSIDTTYYAYLGRDLRKTILFTSAIVILELILSYYL